MYGGDRRLGTRVYYPYYYLPDDLHDIYHMCCIENETRAADSGSRRKLSTESVRQKSDSWKALDIKVISSILARKAHVNKYIMYVKTPHSQPIGKGHISLEVEARLYVAFALELGKHRMSNTAKSRA
jgi:hypothetical protein